MKADVPVDTGAPSVSERCAVRLGRAPRPFASGGAASVLARSIAALAVVVCGACAVGTALSSEPAWLQAKVAQFERLPAASPPRAILRTTYAGRTAYYVTPTCCDIPSELYDESGALLCFPSGGLAGGDGRCRDFTLAPDSATVWRDGRAAATRSPASGGK